MRGERFFTVRVTLIVKEHVAGGLLRRHFAEIDGRGLAVFRTQQHKTAAADIPGLRMGDRQRVADRHRRIDGVAALAQNVHTDAGGQGIHRGHHPLSGANRVEHILLYAIRDRRRRWRTGGNGKTPARQQRSDDHLTPDCCFYHCLTPDR